jgi:putative toxin-antitoxin system antitoxin component (TIGR02293 family)
MARAGRKAKAREDAPIAGAWTQISGHHGALREAVIISGRFQLAPDSIDALKARGFTNDELYRIVAPRRTLARRKERGENLTVAESDRVLRLERISEMADRVFASHEKARRWLRKESRALDGARPMDLLQSETGAHIVEQELHRIDYGMFA